MCSYSQCNDAVPIEYRPTAETLFPPNGFPAGKWPDIQAALDFADILGVGADYRRLLALDKSGRQFLTYLAHFQNNMDLMIQKTWVEKADEKRKEKLQDKLPELIALIEGGEYPAALEEFGAAILELAYLFFGAQSTRDDFTEYAFRVDEQMGLFFWYGGRLALLKELNEKELPAAAAAAVAGEELDECLRAVLLIGICYVTNF
ncbi:MAG: hypothetical protein FWG66_06945 [Spirochaetes bacterium]|nr:hypothetical protein [Spirochaetota bacterium]